MEALGEKIRKTREEKGFTLDQIARDTHITKRFLEALEKEDYSVLPGESYVVGFLRTYCEYLGLNSTEMIHLYRNIQLQEQPAPMEELLDRRGMSPLAKVILGLVIVLGLGVGAWILYNTSPDAPVSDEVKAAEVKVPEGTVVFDGRVLERRFVEGTRFLIKLETGDKDVTVLYKDNKPTLAFNGAEVPVELNQESMLDLDTNGQPDIRMVIRSVDTSANPVRLQVLIDRRIEGEPNLVVAPVVSDSAQVLASLPSVGVASGVGRARGPITVLEASTAQALVGKITFADPVFFRIQSDGTSEVSRFAQAGESLDVKADKVLRMWISDGSKATLTVGAKTIELGTPGELAAWQLLWTGAAGAFTLQLQALF